MFYRRISLLCLVLLVYFQTSQGQRLHLFSPKVKKEYPSVVYDFLERYLCEINRLQYEEADIVQKLHNDKVIFVIGAPTSVQQITDDLTFNIAQRDDKLYEVSWTDEQGNVILDMAFPMQYELLLGKPKVEIEKEFLSELRGNYPYTPQSFTVSNLIPQEDGCLMTDPALNYYVESLNTAVYYQKDSIGNLYPTFTDSDKWHSSANLFQGLLDSIGEYRLYVEQQLYGFQKSCYTITLEQWIAYCQAMKLIIYFGIEEEREDGLKALLIAQSIDLGFNHMLSLVIPSDFVANRKTVLKATLNAYIPTQNVKELYQQYIEKPKKEI